jgi:hypothetical protein
MWARRGGYFTLGGSGSAGPSRMLRPPSVAVLRLTFTPVNSWANDTHCPNAASAAAFAPIAAFNVDGWAVRIPSVTCFPYQHKVPACTQGLSRGVAFLRRTQGGCVREGGPRGDKRVPKGAARARTGASAGGHRIASTGETSTPMTARRSASTSASRRTTCGGSPHTPTCPLSALPRCRFIRPSGVRCKGRGSPHLLRIRL